MNWTHEASTEDPRRWIRKFAFLPKHFQVHGSATVTWIWWDHYEERVYRRGAIDCGRYPFRLAQRRYVRKDGTEIYGDVMNGMVPFPEDRDYLVWSRK